MHSSINDWRTNASNKILSRHRMFARMTAEATSITISISQLRFCTHLTRGSSTEPKAWCYRERSSPSLSSVCLYSSDAIDSGDYVIVMSQYCMDHSHIACITRVIICTCRSDVAIEAEIWFCQFLLQTLQKMCNN